VVETEKFIRFTRVRKYIPILGQAIEICDSKYIPVDENTDDRLKVE
jgi:hypothetical protein